MSGSFAARDLQFTFALPDGRTFAPGSNANVLTVRGLAAEVIIDNIVSNGLMPYQATAIIHGLTPNQINALTTVGKEYGFQAPTKAPFMTIQAGSIGGSYATVFAGPIFRSTFIGNQPNVSFQLLARWASLLQMLPVTPTSFNGSVSVGTVLKAIAAKVPAPLGPLQIETNGVNVNLSYPYFEGSAQRQIQAAAQAANLYVATEPPRTIAVYPRPDGARQQGNTDAPMISAETGLIGYPEFDGLYISVRTVFNPGLTLGTGRLFQVSSTLAKGYPLQAANGTWAARSVSYQLSSQTPSGPWEMVLTGYPPNGIKSRPTYVGMLGWDALR